MKIYVDFDDILSETALYFSHLVKKMFGKYVPYEDMKATYQLPGLFEFYEFYKIFLPVFYAHREFFYEWCQIGSIYGAPAECLWGGGRAGYGENKTGDC